MYAIIRLTVSPTFFHIQLQDQSMRRLVLQVLMLLVYLFSLLLCASLNMGGLGYLLFSIPLNFWVSRCKSPIVFSISLIRASNVSNVCVTEVVRVVNVCAICVIL
jgi:hypothetical protein